MKEQLTTVSTMPSLDSISYILNTDVLLTTDCIDTGFSDTASNNLDMYCWTAGTTKRKHICINGRWVLAPNTLVEDITNQILSFDFEKCTKIIKQDNGNVIKQKYYINDKIDGCTFYYNPMRYYLTIIFQHHMLLGKSQKEVIQYIKNIFAYYFLVPNKLVDRLDKYIKLSRIDYKRDYRYRDEQELVLMKEIIELAPDYIIGQNYKKIDEKENHPDWDNFDDYVYMQKYQSKSNATAQFVIYDKQLEQESKYRDGKITQEQLDKYNNVIRFEVRIKDKKLNNLFSNLGTTKELDNYKNEEMADNFFKTYTEVAFFKEPFYRVDYAIRLINESSKKPKTKKKLVKLVKLINEKGYTYTQQHYEFNSNTFRNHIKILRSLKINPITFSSTWKDSLGNEHRTTYTQIPNFIQKENCLQNEQVIIPSKVKEVMEQVKIN